jgi:hypothetical protein
MPDTPTYDYIDGPVYSTNKYGYSTRPMSDTQAISLLQRLADVLTYRMDLSKEYNPRNPRTRHWRDNMKPGTGVADKTQRQLYEEKLVGLNTSLSNINRLKVDDVYNISAHEVSVRPTEEGGQPVYPSGEDPTDPVVNAKFIIKAIDGIAILNTILNINDIRNKYFGEPDHALYANGLINDAYRAYRKVDETYANNKDYPWKDQSYKNNNYTKHYTVDRIEQMRVYPHFVDKTDPDRVTDKWYTFTGKFYKYVNTIAILSGAAGHADYVDIIPDEFKTSTYGFTFTNNFESITGHADQKTYIETVLNAIAPKPNDKPSAIYNEFVRYVKDFAIDYVNIHKLPEEHHPISSAFDYFLIDYLIQILEAEYELYVSLLDNYKWSTKSEIDVDKSLENAQYNDAPFYYSSCNGASCVGLCYGSCVNTCNGCGGCTGYCSTACGGTCTSDCMDNCNNRCGKHCGQGCEKTCDNSCTGECQTNCTTFCNTGCKTGCKNGCSGCKETCNTGCKTTCSDGCKDGCNISCGGSCKDVCGDSCSSDGTHTAITKTVTNNVSHPTAYTWTGLVEHRRIDANGNVSYYYSNGPVKMSGSDGTFTQNNGLYGSAWTQNGGAGYSGPSDTGPRGFDSSVNSIYSSSD